MEVSSTSINTAIMTVSVISHGLCRGRQSGCAEMDILREVAGVDMGGS